MSTHTSSTHSSSTTSHAVSMDSAFAALYPWCWPLRYVELAEKPEELWRGRKIQSNEPPFATREKRLNLALLAWDYRGGENETVFESAAVMYSNCVPLSSRCHGARQVTSLVLWRQNPHEAREPADVDEFCLDLQYQHVETLFLSMEGFQDIPAPTDVVSSR